MVQDISLEVQRLYAEKLPPASRGKEADNPDRFYSYFTNQEERSKNPNIVLAEDLDFRILTWHEVCDWVITPQIINKSRYDRELVASMFRNMRLRFLEVYSNRTKSHFFCEPAASGEVSWEDINYRRETYLGIPAIPNLSHHQSGV